VRGIRQQFHWHKDPQYCFAQHAELCRDTRVQRDMARLADYALTFDLQVFAGQMAGAAELAQACPRVVFVLQHAARAGGLSISRQRAGGLAKWHGSLGHLPQCHGEAFWTWYLSASRGCSAYRLGLPQKHWRGLVMRAAFGAQIFRSKNSGPIMHPWLAAHRNAMRDLDETAMRALFDRMPAGSTGFREE
jgi:hypothetical protein